MSDPIVGKIAHELIELCRKGENEKAIRSLYSPDIVSVEGFSMAGEPRESHGLDAVLGKMKWWQENHTVHAATVTGPFLAENKFAVDFDFDVTFKPDGQRKRMHEVAVYTVSGGKIVHEEFLYAM